MASVNCHEEGQTLRMTISEELLYTKTHEDTLIEQLQKHPFVQHLIVRIVHNAGLLNPDPDTVKDPKALWPTSEVRLDLPTVVCADIPYWVAIAQHSMLALSRFLKEHQRYCYH